MFKRFLAAAFLLTTPALADTSDPRISRIETVAAEIPQGEGTAPLRFSLDTLMKAYDAPGLSIAVIENGRISWAKGYGVTETGGTVPVTAHTLFQAASISKPVAAAGAMLLVQAGKLNLDTDVNMRLKSWKVPDNTFTATQKVTLRRLMSHTAGLSVSGFSGYDIAAPLPTVAQILNGEAPANTSAVRVIFEPGSKAQYSGGGITVEQLLMTEVTGQSFPVLMDRLVLKPFGMSDSSYDQPLPADRAQTAAAGTYGNGKTVHGRSHIYPEMAAAGLWTTPSDLARFSIAIADARTGHKTNLLSQATATEMLTKAPNGDALGFFTDDKVPGLFGHNGTNEGFRSLMVMNWQTGQGIVIMVNSDNGSEISAMILQRYAVEYGWKQDLGPIKGFTLIAKTQGVEAVLAHYDALRKANSSSVAESELNILAYTLMRDGQDMNGVLKVLQHNAELYPESGNVYDSLGEVYMAMGQKEKAIANYRKSLEKDPGNINAVAKLKELGL